MAKRLRLRSGSAMIRTHRATTGATFAKDSPGQDHPATSGLKIRRLLMFDQDTSESVTMSAAGYTSTLIYRS